MRKYCTKIILFKIIFKEPRKFGGEQNKVHGTKVDKGSLAFRWKEFHPRPI